MDTQDPHNDPRTDFDGGTAEEPSPRGARYEQARSAFDDLGIEDKAVFLMEAATRTITRGIEDGARRLSDELNRAFDDL